ncbi:A-kinase anchor protein 8-like isoform X2 [Lepisosteus oculatus]|uniref:A-kinase anchor protein 8-like isoform X2 n=1 Tax=Lepisosteus oculatus TaxID=7918 RepID=UPI0035F52E89
MDGRGYGYSSWSGGSSSRGSGGYDSYGFGYGKDSDSGFGGYGGQKRGLSGVGGPSSLSTTGTSADAVIAKINQRLDMLTQLEGAGAMKGHGGGRSDRFDQYESFDSRATSLNDRDLYRSGYGYSEGGPDHMPPRGGAAYGGPGGYDGSGYGSGKSLNPRQPRDTYGQGWAARRSPRGPGGGRGFGRWSEPPMGGRGGPSPGGKLPSLLSHHMYPEMGMYQPPGAPDYPGRRYGGGAGMWAGRQRVRKRTPSRQVKVPKDGKKKRKQSLTAADEPESKIGKTEQAGSESANEAEEPSAEAEDGKATTEVEDSIEGEDALTMQEEISQVKKRLQGKPQGAEKPKQKKRSSRFLERVMFACSVCKFRSFYNDEMTAHLESRFHKEHFKFLASKLSKPTTDFLQEYLLNKYKKTEVRRNHMENISAAICQVYKEQDLTRDIGMEHFVRKVEAAHCAACDIFIPMQHNLIQKHLKSPDHNFNRRGMMEQSKRSSLSVARSILNHKVIGKKLESYLKGENPFTNNPDEQDPDESMPMDVTEGEVLNESQGDGAPEGEGEGEAEAEGVLSSQAGEEEEEEVKEEEEEGEGLEMEDEGDMEGVPGEEVLELGEEEGNEEEVEGNEVEEEEGDGPTSSCKAEPQEAL